MQFWMVLGRGVPSVRHTSVEKAIAEAERLARLHSDQEFIVLESVGSVRVADLTWTSHEPPPKGIELNADVASRIAAGMDDDVPY